MQFGVKKATAFLFMGTMVFTISSSFIQVRASKSPVKTWKTSSLKVDIRNEVKKASEEISVEANRRPSRITPYVPNWNPAAQDPAFVMRYMMRDPSQDEVNLNDKLLSPKLQRQFRREYREMTRRHEFYKQYGLTDRHDEKSLMDRMADFKDYLFRHILNFQVKENMKKAEKHSEGARTFRQVHDTVKSVYQGGHDVQVNDSFKFGTRTDIPNKNAQIWMKSDYLNGALDMNFGKAWSPEPEDELEEEGHERYALTLSRPLPWKMNTGVSYGGSTTKLTSTLSKQLTDHLSAHVSHTKGLDEVRAGYFSEEGLVRLSYGISF